MLCLCLNLHGKRRVGLTMTRMSLTLRCLWQTHCLTHFSQTQCPHSMASTRGEILQKFDILTNVTTDNFVDSLEMFLTTLTCATNETVKNLFVTLFFTRRKSLTFDEQREVLSLADETCL